MSEKEELLFLLNHMERMMRANPSGFMQDEKTKEMLARFNSLSSVAPTLGLTSEEQKEANEKWQTLSKLIENYNKKLEIERAKSPQETLLDTLREIKASWDSSKIDVKRELVKKAASLQIQHSIIDNMTPDEREVYYDLMGEIKGMAEVEKIPYEDFMEEVKKAKF